MSKFQHTAFIALGSNLQNPKHQVQQALEAIKSLEEIQFVQASSLYKTAPVGYDNQDDFINAVAEIKTDLAPIELLRGLLRIENTFGRERPFPNAPRVLDLDLLLYDDIAMDSAELTLPHPRMHERGFVMIPLAEISPKLTVGKYGHADELAAKCDNQGVIKFKET
jgi:2-amino-4-hydroxy-6-hydroxymethyldihydropteridine diphosphokinase